jgi:hypothetical protein
MANELLTYDEYLNMLLSEYKTMAWSQSTIFTKELSIPFEKCKGKRVFFLDGGMVILFEACEWCGSKDGLNKNGNCSRCGGYPTASR